MNVNPIKKSIRDQFVAFAVAVAIVVAALVAYPLLSTAAGDEGANAMIEAPALAGPQMGDGGGGGGG